MSNDSQSSCVHQVRIGVIGLGGIARGVHIPGIIESDGGVLTAICDINAETLAKKEKEYNIKHELCFERYQDLIASSEVDAVCICTPNDVHYCIAKCAIENSKPFALEKPVTIKSQEAGELYRESANIPHMVCFSYRFKSAARYAKSLIEKGVIGKIIHVYGEYHQSWGIPDTTNLSWRFQKKHTGSGVLGDLGCHMLDLIRFTAGEISEVSGDCGIITPLRKNEADGSLYPVDVDDYFHSIIKLKNGATGTMNTSRFAFGRGNYQRLDIYGTKGALSYNNEKEDTLSVCCGPLEQGHQFVELSVPEEFKVRQMQEFVNICNGTGSPLSANLKDGYQVQILLDALLDAAESKTLKSVELI